MLTSCAIRPRIATLTVVTKRTVARASIRLVTVTTLRLSLVLIKVPCPAIARISVRLLTITALGLPVSCRDRLVHPLSPSILRFEPASVLLVKVGLSGALLSGALLPEIRCIFVSKLLLIPLLVKLRCVVATIVEIVRAVVGVI